MNEVCFFCRLRHIATNQRNEKILILTNKFMTAQVFYFMVMSAQNAKGVQETLESHLDQGQYCTGASRLLEKDTLDRKNGEKTPL